MPNRARGNKSKLPTGRPVDEGVPATRRRRRATRRLARAAAAAAAVVVIGLTGIGLGVNQAHAAVSAAVGDSTSILDGPHAAPADGLPVDASVDWVPLDARTDTAPVASSTAGWDRGEWEWLIAWLFPAKPVPVDPAPTPIPLPDPTFTPVPILIPDPAPVPILIPDPIPAPIVVPVPTPTPVPDPISTPDPTPIVADSGAPNAGNTGVPAGTALTIHDGDLRITEPGTIISGLDVRGMIIVEAPNVTIENSIVRGRDLNGPMALIGNLGGFVNLKIIDTELFPSTPSPHMQGIYGYNFEATRLNIHGVIDGIHLTGGNVDIIDSWLHDNLHYQRDPNHGGTPSHDDSIQIQEGSNIRIDGNRFSGAWNATVQVTQDRGDVADLTFTNNIADGGKCSINIAEKDHGPVKGVVISDNSFGRNTRVDDCAVIAPSSTKVSMARNYYTPDDALVQVRAG